MEKAPYIARSSYLLTNDAQDAFGAPWANSIRERACRRIILGDMRSIPLKLLHFLVWTLDFFYSLCFKTEVLPARGPRFLILPWFFARQWQ